jgi:hypothetical protein
MKKMQIRRQNGLNGEPVICLSCLDLLTLWNPTSMKSLPTPILQKNFGILSMKKYGLTNNSSRIFELQQKIFSLKQSSEQPFIEHFGKVKKYWEELRQYRPAATSVGEYLKREE